MIISKLLGKYWLLQFLIVGVLASYAVGMSVGILLFIESTQPDQSAENVSVLLIIESKHPSYPLNYSDLSTVPVNLTLIEHINNTIGRENWDGVKYGVAGWFIKRIFNVTEEGSWYWLYYYRNPGETKWISSSWGVSSFKLNQDYEIRFVFDST